MLRRAFARVLFAGTTLLASRAHAQSIGPDALPAIVTVPVADSVHPGAAVAATAGYGYTESVLDGTDSHHRVFGSIAAAGSPLPWLSAGLRFDGRYDWHQTSQGPDDGLVGDPRVFVRAATRLNSSLGIGAHLSVWFPGDGAPSIVPSAITPELTAFATVFAGPLAFTADAGYRLDNSRASVTDRAALSAADRVSLGLNGSDALLVRAGARFQHGALQLLAEWTWDVLVGTNAPPLGESPMHARVGFRVRPWAEQAFDVGLVLDATLSSRPSLDPAAPLVAIDPRVSGFITLAAQIPFVVRNNTGATETEPRTATMTSSSASPQPAQHGPGSLGGRVLGDDGAPLEGATVRITGPAGANVEQTTSADGRYHFDDLAPGRYALTIVAPRRPEVHRTVTVSPGAAPQEDTTMERALPAGQIRGVVRAFTGEAVAASIDIEPGHQHLQADAQGEFTLDATPGRYTVRIAAPGFREQTRRVEVVENGVIVLTVDLQGAGR